MDQAFSFCKGIMEKNRRKLFKVKDSHDGSGVTLYDLPYILFGGNLKLQEVGKTLNLSNAFKMVFDREHLRVVVCGAPF